MLPGTLILWAALAAAPSSDVTIVVEEGSDPSGVIAARFLAEKLEPAPAVETATRGTDLPAILEKARSTWRSRFVIVLAPERGQISVIQCEDGTALTRLIDAKVVRQSPYVLAVSAEELFELARRPRSDPNAPIMLPVVDADFSFSAGAGLSVGSGPSNVPFVWMPSLAASLIYRSAGASWWASSDLWIRFLGRTQRSLSLSGEQLSIDYTRQEAQLSVAAGVSRRALDVGLAAGAGVSLTGVSVEATEIRDNRLIPWFSIGGRLRQRFGAFGLSLSADLLLLPQQVRYFARDQVVLEEPAVRVQATLIAFWEG